MRIILYFQERPPSKYRDRICCLFVFFLFRQIKFNFSKYSELNAIGYEYGLSECCCQHLLQNWWQHTIDGRVRAHWNLELTNSESIGFVSFQSKRTDTTGLFFRILNCCMPHNCAFCPTHQQKKGELFQILGWNVNHIKKNHLISITMIRRAY